MKKKRESFTEILRFVPDILEPVSLRARLAMFFVPVALFWVFSFLIYWFEGWPAFAFFFAVAAANLVGGGRFLILSGAAPGTPLGVWELAALIAFTDVSVSLMLLACIPLFCRIPLLGRSYLKLRKTGLTILQKHPWLGRTAFLGVALFVALPLQGTGAVIGTVLARITGLSRLRTVLAVGVGGIVGAGFVAACGYLGKDQVALLVAHPVWGLGAVALLFLAMYALGKRLTA